MMPVSHFDMACPIDSRYYGADRQFFDRVKPYVSEESFIRYQARVEIALVQVFANHDIVTQEFPDEVRKACQELTAEEVYAEEGRIGHIVRALVNCIRSKVSEKVRPYVHLFATSNDITDTANALRIKELTRDVILPDLIQLQETLIHMAREHAHTLQIGRTHGKHAEPITFGYALANYVSRIGERTEYIETAVNKLRGKFSGAVGAYNALSLVRKDPALFEAEFLAELGLRPKDWDTGGLVSTQIVHPEYLTDLVHGITSAFSVLANLADDIRHLHRSEIAEVQETYEKEEVGSSTMPHKINPKNFEFVKSMWKEFMPRMMTVYMDQISEHQRDLTNSASGRFVTEFFTAFIYSLNRLTASLKKLHVLRENMERNLKTTTFDEILAEPLYILLSYKGHPDGHRCARRLVTKARSKNIPLTKLVWEDEEVKPYLTDLTDQQVRVLREPFTYSGAAVERTKAVCDAWEMRTNIVKQRVRAGS